jgi:hypothetical protein
VTVFQGKEVLADRIGISHYTIIEKGKLTDSPSKKSPFHVSTEHLRVPAPSNSTLVARSISSGKLGIIHSPFHEFQIQVGRLYCQVYQIQELLQINLTHRRPGFCRTFNSNPTTLVLEVEGSVSNTKGVINYSLGVVLDRNIVRCSLFVVRCSLFVVRCLLFLGRNGNIQIPKEEMFQRGCTDLGRQSDKSSGAPPADNGDVLTTSIHNEWINTK